MLKPQIKEAIQRYLYCVINEDIDLWYPKNILREVTGDRTVKYNVKVQEEHRGYSCTVKVGRIEVTSVSGRSSPDEVMTRAADNQ